MEKRRLEYEKKLKAIHQKLYKTELDKNQGLLCLICSYVGLCTEIAIDVIRIKSIILMTIAAIAFVIGIIVASLVFMILIIIFIPFFVFSALKRKGSS